MNFIVIGSVESSNIFLKECIDNGFIPSHVFGLDEEYSNNVSGYYPIYKTAQAFNIPNTKFKKINDYIGFIKCINPDYIFVIGLSQLIEKELISCAEKSVIGMHPTKLPKFRGRAAIPWQIILGVRESAVSFFKITEGVDDGDILFQEPYIIDTNDYSYDVHIKVYDAMKRASKKLLVGLRDENIKGVKQNNIEATYLLIRREEDGRIDWNMDIYQIYALIRAASYPYPGAFAYYENKKVIFNRAEIINESPYIGIDGQIAKIENNILYLVKGKKLLKITDYNIEEDIRFIVGHKFK